MKPGFTRNPKGLLAGAMTGSGNESPSRNSTTEGQNTVC
jgi:hypothetical protein